MSRMLGLGARVAIVGVAIGAAILSTTGSIGPVGGLLTLPYTVMGSLLVIRRPRTSIGWLLLGVGTCWGLIAVPVMTQPELFANGSVDPPVALFAIVHQGLPTTMFYLYAVLVMVFPSGGLPMGRWGRLGRIALVAELVVVGVAYVMPEINVGFPVGSWVRNPIALLPDASIWGVVKPGTITIPIMFLVIAGLVSMIVRARRATGTERQQLHWIGAAFGVLMAAVISGLAITTLVPGSEGLAWIPAMLAVPMLPISIAIAVLRYRLYEIDRIISRTIGYALVTAVLAGVFLATNLALQTWVAGVTGESTVGVAVTTLLVAALFQPLRRATQAPIDRRFNRARVDADRTLAAFGDRVREEVQLARLSSVVVAAADEAVRPTAAGLWLRGGAR